MEYTEPPSPMTHDLIKAMISESKGKINSVKITDLIDGVFYARIEIQGSLIGALNLDSRPSDAIAIALRMEAPIFVDESIMDEASQYEEDDNKIGSEIPEIEDQKEDLESKLKQAVELEKYEEAAVIRDQLKEYS